MNLIPLTDIIVPENRQRREFDQKKLDDLANSIAARGLMHPVVVRDDGKTLVAGERRLRAITSLHERGRAFNCQGDRVPTGHIPTTPLGSLGSLALREAELEENTIRSDLTWQERAKAEAELHRLRQDQHGAWTPSTPDGWSATDTASEVLGRPAKKFEVQQITTALALEEFLDDPFVASAKSPKEALKLIKEEKKRLHRQERAKHFDPSLSPHKLIHGDSYEVLELPEYKNAFDVVVADPPYGIDIDKMTCWDGTKHNYDDSEEAFRKVKNVLPYLLRKVTKPQAHAYIFCDWKRFNDLFVTFELNGWAVWPYPIIWHKGNTGSFPNADYGPRRTYECILYANRGQKPVTAMYLDVIIRQNPSKTDHPAEKPSDVLSDLLRRSVYPGDKILDPYCGSGNIFIAASEVKCTATGIEIDETYHNMAMEKLEELK